MSSEPSKSTRLPRTLGTSGVATAAIALVVSGSTLVTDFTGFVNLGAGYTICLAIGLLTVIPVVVSASDLTVTNPVAGGIYQYARSVKAPVSQRETTGFRPQVSGAWVEANC